jgi:glycerophosphoryl diester phosphodiesterase
VASFDLALASGCDGFEFDLRLTADGQAVVCHDETNGENEIARCSAGQLALPLLRDVLIGYQSTAFLDIELKVPGLEEIVVDLLRNFPPRRGFVVSSFLPDVLQTLRNMEPAFPLGLICETRTGLSHWSHLPVAYVIPHYQLVSQNLIDEFKAADKRILVWTVNSSAEMKRFSRWGVDGVISDYPRRVWPRIGTHS